MLPDSRGSPSDKIEWFVGPRTIGDSAELTESSPQQRAPSPFKESNRNPDANRRANSDGLQQCSEYNGAFVELFWYLRDMQALRVMLSEPPDWDKARPN